MPRMGNQHPTLSHVLPYTESKGQEAIDRYNESGNKMLEWQELLVTDILAVNEDGLWVHTKVGYSIPRRNGKSEVILDRELWGILENHEKALHTAHRTTTSHASSVKLVKMLDALGYHEVQRITKGKSYEKSYTYSKQFGLERVTILDEGGGSVDFRTRSGKGGLGEGFDLLIIDEAQEYTDDQESALKYVVSDSANPQIIMCGTPPTTVSAGTVFPKFRDDTLDGISPDSMWAEWGVEQMSDVNDIELWYLCNPSMGFILNERKVRAEIGSDTVDFNIQRLGLWLKYNQKSAISENEWMALKADKIPDKATPVCIGIKYGIDGTNVALSIAFKTTDGRLFVEGIDCKSVRQGTDWLVRDIVSFNPASVVVDGASGQMILANALKEAGAKQKPIFPTTKEVIVANSQFEQAVYNNGLCHMAQPALVQIASNCLKRSIGSAGGFGYKAIKPDTEIALLDSVILAMWAAAQVKEAKKQKVHY